MLSCCFSSTIKYNFQSSKMGSFAHFQGNLPSELGGRCNCQHKKLAQKRVGGLTPSQETSNIAA